MRWGKPDSVQPGIVTALRKAGAHVVILSGVGLGVADLAVLRAGKTTWIEVKSDAAAVKRKSLTAVRQAEFRDQAAAHGVTVHIVTTPEEALRAIGALA